MKRLLVSAAAVAVAVVLIACSSDDAGSTGSGCNTDPFSCPIGTTCWETDAKTFKCLASGSGKEGDVCTNYFGQPTCNDGLFCFNAQGQMTGLCTSFCDNTNPQHACPTGIACRAAYFPGGAGVNICAPAAPMDAGVDGAADAGTDAPTEAAADSAADAPSDAPGQ
jgi:hypothetical protein